MTHDSCIASRMLLQITRRIRPILWCVVLMGAALPGRADSPAETASPSTAAAPERVHFAQLGAFTTREEALAAQSAAKGRNVDTIVALRGGRHCVLSGAFDYYVDAHLHAQALRKWQIAPDAFVVSLEANPAGDTFRRRSTPHLDSVFKLQKSETIKATDLPVQKLESAAYRRLEELDRPGNEATYKLALEKAMAEVSPGDPLVGYIQANLGILLLKEQRYDNALNYLIPVATGEVPASASHRVMAMNRTAWLWHQTGDRLRAYQAYRELEGFTANPRLRAKCQVECLGLMMELAESGKGDHEEVRRHAAELLAGIDEKAYPKERAITELISLETYARQPERDYKMAAALSEQFIEKYTPLNSDGSLNRELATAMYETGMFHRLSKNLDQATYWYERTLIDFPSDVEHFRGLHPHAQSILGLANVAFHRKDYETHKELRRLVVQEFPDDLTTKAILRNSPELRTGMPAPEASQ
ncbi:MAG: hypothetical protein PWP23_974 [Candidatus Sumerlaeota bacterium]|nr:hypothetical protein [Candidatus Sumerlaeota bacterium]